MFKGVFALLIILNLTIATTGLSSATESYDKTLFYKVVEAETRELAKASSEVSYESKLHVANVILNRVNHSSFPNTIDKVIMEKGQFSVIPDGSAKKAIPSEETVRAVNDALNGKWMMSSKVLYFNTKSCNSWAERNRIKWGSDTIHVFYYQ